MNELMVKDRIVLTPIEIALGIDDDGKVSAKKLYEFLELNQANYSRWCQSKILENEFASANDDYIPFVIYDERNPNPTTDYKLTAAFAKKLDELSRTARDSGRNDSRIMDALSRVAAWNKEVVENYLLV